MFPPSASPFHLPLPIHHHHRRSLIRAFATTLQPLGTLSYQDVCRLQSALIILSSFTLKFSFVILFTTQTLHRSLILLGSNTFLPAPLHASIPFSLMNLPQSVFSVYPSPPLTSLFLSSKLVLSIHMRSLFLSTKRRPLTFPPLPLLLLLLLLHHPTPPPFLQSSLGNYRTWCVVFSLEFCFFYIFSLRFPPVACQAFIILDFPHN